LGVLITSPVKAPDGDEAERDRRLVTAVRHGDDAAFEALYGRYQPRIHAFVAGKLHDHGRAEDVTQEIFISALRRMRATEQPIAFRPWVYEIARNACIDAHRLTTRRAETVSFAADADPGAADPAWLEAPGPSPELAVDTKQQIDHLRGAFGGLSDQHHEILVLRELEGLSYAQIGERMGLGRQGVESTLLRARRRLTEEYDELASGERCRQVQALIDEAGPRTTRFGVRKERRIGRHIAHCQPCRRTAAMAGMDVAALGRRTMRGKLGALLPLPA
jgi:RNA polymerase sigma factor (sigma-70 family)